MVGQQIMLLMTPAAGPDQPAQHDQSYATAHSTLPGSHTSPTYIGNMSQCMTDAGWK